ncbi:MAG: LmeA family phospholipid-binding protein [cyanobacterium endosymbiont of Rhopalodia sterrenbergii]
MLFSPAGLVVDKIVADTIRSQVNDVEELAVRIDNTPSYQSTQGRIDRVRIASRGIKPIEDFRIEVLELETDSIDVNINNIQTQNIKGIRQSLRNPLQGGLSLIIKEKDINRALESDKIREKLQKTINTIVPEQVPKFRILTLRVEFKPKDRLGVKVKLQQLKRANEEYPSETIALNLEAGFKVKDGRLIQVLDPRGELNDKTLSQKFLSRFQQFDLAVLEGQGIITRLLKLKVDEESFALVSFIRLEPLK